MKYSNFYAKLTMEEVLFYIDLYVKRWSFVGSIRRKENLVSDIDVMIEPYDSKTDLECIKLKLESFSVPSKLGERVGTYDDVLGRRIKLEVYYLTPPRSWFPILVHRTGPAKVTKLVEQRALNILGPNWIDIPFKSEKEFFNAINLPHYPPYERTRLLDDERPYPEVEQG